MSRMSYKKWCSLHPVQTEEENHLTFLMHKEKVKKECDKQWQQCNVEKSRKNKRAYAQSERGKQKKQGWEQENKLRVRAYKAAWKRNNPESDRASQARRRDLERSLGSSTSRGLPASKRQLVREQFQNTCFKCGNHEKLHLDHHMPLTAGYALELGNAVLLCSSCNSSKRDLYPEDFYSFSELQTLNRLLAEQKS